MPKVSRVWQRKPDKRGAVNVGAWVDKTFSFLLPRERDYRGFSRHKNSFFSFLAGFTDAEGSFFISDNQARIAWGNYDVTALRFIKRNLSLYGIETPKIYKDHLQGTVGVHGYQRNSNYCHLVCTKKAVIGRLLTFLEPYVQHEGKKEGMVRLRKNLILRGVLL